MPWSVERRDCEQADGTKGRYVVVKDTTGEVESCHTTRAEAEAAVRAREANVNEERESRSVIEEIDEDLGLGLGAKWVRSSLAKGLELKEGRPEIDRENRVIEGFAVVSKGEARGHNVMLDETFLDQVVEHGNKAKRGVKMRFDHPNASNTSMGTALGRAKRFRRDGEVVRADAHLLNAASKSPNGDLATYVMDLAEEDPAAFGASLVFVGDELDQRDEDGNRIKGAPKLARLGKLLATDVVDDPAANPGGFLSEEASLATKITAFLDRYFDNRARQSVHVLNQGGGKTMEPGSVEARSPVHGERDAEQIRQEGISEERARVTGIQKAMLPGQDALCVELIQLGVTVEEAAKTFKMRRLAELQNTAPQSAGGGSDIELQEDLSALPEEERWRKEWDRNASLRQEFGQLPTYLAFKRNEGKVRVYKGGSQNKNEE